MNEKKITYLEKVAISLLFIGFVSRNAMCLFVSCKRQFYDYKSKALVDVKRFMDDP